MIDRTKRSAKLTSALAATLVVAACTPASTGAKRPPTFAETVWPKTPAKTFRNYHNASGVGPLIHANETVRISCRVFDPTIPSVKPGWWYRVASPPWSNRYYTPANLFLNGDPPQGPERRAVDRRVPICP